MRGLSIQAGHYIWRHGLSLVRRGENCRTSSISLPCTDRIDAIVKRSGHVRRGRKSRADEAATFVAFRPRQS